MVTYFLSEADIAAYFGDLLTRLSRLSPAPAVLCPMTRSGTVLLKAMLPLMAEKCPALTGATSVVAVSVNDDTGEVQLNPAGENNFAGKHIFLFDGAIHSGRMMSLCVDHFVNKLGAAGVCTYSLVVKRGAAFIPTFWSLMIDDTDRAFFLLNTIPNNRLDTGKEGRPQPYVHLRLLKDGDMDLPPVNTGVVGLDRVTWGDRLFNMKTTPGRSTYLLQSESKIVGYLTITLADGGVFYIDEVAVDEKHQGQNGKGYGPILMRFADSLARHNDCRMVRLYAINDRIQFYEGHGYKVVQSVAPIPLDTNTYQLMERPILYHLRHTMPELF